MGFEPTKGVTLYTLSKRAPSTTRTPLLGNRSDFKKLAWWPGVRPPELQPA